MLLLNVDLVIFGEHGLEETSLHNLYQPCAVFAEYSYRFNFDNCSYHVQRVSEKGVTLVPGMIY